MLLAHAGHDHTISPIMLALLIAGLIAIIAGAVYFFIRRRKNGEN